MLRDHGLPGRRPPAGDRAVDAGSSPTMRCPKRAIIDIGCSAAGESLMASVLAAASRLVIKVGSSLVTNDGQGLDHAGARGLGGADRGARASAGREVILVSSGAIAEGMQRLGLEKASARGARAAGRGRGRPDGTRPGLRVLLREARAHTSQVLLTHDDLADRKRYLNARSTLRTLLDARRDPGHQRERHGRHRRDPLRRQRHARLRSSPTSSKPTCSSSSPIRPVSTPPIPARSPRPQLVRNARAGDPALERMAGGAGSDIGRGGMLTKVIAAKRAARSGAHTVIVSGREPDVLVRLDRGRVDRHRAHGGRDDPRRAQAMDRGSPAGEGPARARRGRRTRAAARRQEPAADRRARR